MKITENKVTKLVISGSEGLDSISVFIEDFGDGQGGMTTSCWGQAWAYFWGSMGTGVSMIDFFLSADVQYLANKLFDHERGSKSETDTDSLCRHIMSDIVERRKSGDLNKVEARIKFNEADSWSGDELINDHNTMSDLLGCEWWENLPSRSTVEWEYIQRITSAVKEGLAIYKSNKQETES